MGGFPDMTKQVFIDDPHRSRFEMPVDDVLVFAEYRRGPGRIIVERVAFPPKLLSTPAPDRFLEKVVAHVRELKVKLEVEDQTLARWLDAHPEHRDLLVAPLPPLDASGGASAQP